MEVVYYQLFIAVTIVLAHFFMRDIVLWVCGFWTLFTLANLFYPPLIFIQLGVVWGTYFVLKVDSTKSQKIDELESLTLSLPDDLRVKVDTVSDDHKQLLSGIEHYNFLIDSIKNARSRVTILSGWLSSRIVDRSFASLMRTKAKQGVLFYIGYGWQNSQGNHQAGADSIDALQKLKKLARKFPNQIFVAEYGTHEKILVVDSTVAVFGSANWLSNRRYKNSERSIVITDEPLAQSEENRIKALIEQNRVV